MAPAFSMMPLWMTAMRPDWSVCGMRVGRGGRAVGRPAGVPDAHRARRGGALEPLLQHCRACPPPSPPRRPAVHDRDPGGVVAAILQAAQSSIEQARRLTRADVSYNATHRVTPCRTHASAQRCHQCLGFGRRRGFRDLADDRLGARWPNVQPAIAPRPAEVHPARPRPHRETLPERARTADAVPRLGDPSPSRWCTGDAGHQPGHRTPVRGKHLQDQGHPQRRIAADVQRRQHDPPVALAADQRALVPMARATFASPTGARTKRAPYPGRHPRPPGWWTGSPPRWRRLRTVTCRAAPRTALTANASV